MPQDMIDEEGGRYFSDDMMKSLEDATTEVQSFMAATMYAMQEANERTAVKDSLMFQTQIDMNKSIEGLTKVVSDLTEKLEKSVSTTEIVPAGEEKNPLPDLDGTATNPVSEQVDLGGGKPTMTSETLSKAVTSAFPGLYGDLEDLKLQAKYADWAARMLPEDALAAMPEDHRNMVLCQIPN
jgi:polyhydroxyalkanoate synthesis regulator phasin